MNDNKKIIQNVRTAFTLRSGANAANNLFKKKNLHEKKNSSNIEIAKKLQIKSTM